MPRLDRTLCNRDIFFISKVVFQNVLEQAHVNVLLSKVKKIACQGMSCLDRRGLSGFFKPGITPWMGHPTTIKVQYSIMIHNDAQYVQSYNDKSHLFLGWSVN